MAFQPDWSLYRVFLAVVKEGSLTAAGRALGMSQPTVGRHIKALEQGIGYPLFARAPEGLVPSDAALALLPYVTALSDAAGSLARAASTPPGMQGGTVRISASEVVAAEILPTLLQAARVKWPRLEIEILVSNEEADILRGAADLAIRMVRPKQVGLFATRCGISELGLYGHPDYFRGRAVPADLAGLLDHCLIGFDEPRPYTHILAVEGHMIERSELSLRSDSDMAQLAAIRAGLGIGVCHAVLATGLTRVLPAAFSPGVEVWLVMHEDMRSSIRIKALFDAVADRLKLFLAP
jgi:DNA-binding transcriptional LysR family regulator